MNQETTSNQDSSQDWTFKTEEEIKQEQQALAASISSTNEVLVFREKDPSEMLVNLTPQARMEFFQNGVSVGKMDWSSGSFTFTGEADESAKALFQALQFYIESYIQGQATKAKFDLIEYMEKFK